MPQAPEPDPQQPPGVWARYAGPGAAPGIQAAVAGAACGGLLLAVLTVTAPAAHLLVLAVLTAELCGGLVAHLLGPAKVHAHRQGRRAGHHLCWVSGQILVYGIFVWLFRGGDPARLLLVGGLMLAGAGLILATPGPVQRRVALAVMGVALLTVDAALGLVREAGWFLPMLLTRVFIAYLPAPEP